MANEEKLAKFHQAINHYALEQRQKIEEEVADFKKKELQEAEDEVLVESYHLIQKEMADMRGRISREMAQREMAGRRALLEKRNRITQEVFNKASAILSEDTKGEHYPKLLEHFADEARKAFDSRAAGAKLPEDIVFYLRAADKAFQPAIQKAFGAPCSFTEDDSITLGGLRAESAALHLELDSTLDALLENQREWFEEISHLSVG